MKKLFITLISIFIASLSCLMLACGGGKTVTVTFDSNGGTAVQNITVNLGEEKEYQMPTTEYDGYDFLGWYLGEDKLESLSGIEEDTTLVAKWQAHSYTITYVDQLKVANFNPTSYSVESQDIVIEDVAKDGYVFEGWYSGNDKVEVIESGSKGDITLTARWQVVEFTITYQDQMEIPNDNPTSYTVVTPTITLKPLEKEGYKFFGWYSGNDKVTEIKTGSIGDVDLVARWEAVKYAVTYDLDGGRYQSGQSNPSYCTVEDNITLFEPVKENYSFLGWYDVNGTGYYTRLLYRTSNISLKALWGANRYKINYGETAAVENPNPTYYTLDDQDITLLPLERYGYDFNGWFTKISGGEKVTVIDTSLCKDVTVYARWRIKGYNITYVDQFNVQNPNLKSYSINTPTTELVDLQKKGYTFLGWYEGDEKVESISGENPRHITLTAQWQIDTYKIEYVNLKDVDNSQNKTTYQVTTPTFQIKPLTMDGYAFEGWYDQNGNAVSQIELGSAGDLTLKAKWVPSKYNVTFDLNGLISNGSAVQTTVNGSSTLPSAVVNKDGKITLQVAMISPVSNGQGGYYDQAGYYFAYQGWCVEIDGKVKVVTSDTAFTIDTVGDNMDITLRPYFMSMFVPNV